METWRELWRAFVDPVLEPRDLFDLVLHLIALACILAGCAVGTVLVLSCLGGLIVTVGGVR